MHRIRSLVRPAAASPSPSPLAWPGAPSLTSRRIAAFGTSRPSYAQTESPASPIPDALAGEGAKGRTGGGPPLKSSKNAPPPPKVDNAKIRSSSEKLSPEQQREVDEHNAEFEKKHDRAAPAGDDKVDKGFWSGSKGERGK